MNGVSPYPPGAFAAAAAEPVEDEPMDEMMEMVMYAGMRRAGHNFDDEIEAIRAENARFLMERTNALRDRLLQTQRDAAVMARGLLNDVVAVNAFEASQLQANEIELTNRLLKPKEEELEDKAMLAEAELVKKEAFTILLQAQLKDLNDKLVKARGSLYWFQGPMNTFAQKAIRKTYGRGPIDEFSNEDLQKKRGGSNFPGRSQ